MPQGQRQYGQVFLAFFFSSSTYQPSYKHLEGLPYFWIGIEKKVSDVLVGRLVHEKRILPMM